MGRCLAALLLSMGDWMYSNVCVSGLYKFVVWVGICVAAQVADGVYLKKCVTVCDVYFCANVRVELMCIYLHTLEWKYVKSVCVHAYVCLALYQVFACLCDNAFSGSRLSAQPSAL